MLQHKAALLLPQPLAVELLEQSSYIPFDVRRQCLALLFQVCWYKGWSLVYLLPVQCRCAHLHAINSYWPPNRASP